MKKTKASPTLTRYESLPYSTVLKQDETGDYIARLVELPGCLAHGKTEAQALRALASMKRLWIEDCLEAGDPVPEPVQATPLPSGKWVQRVPRTLHRDLVETARAEGVSLNQLVTALLSERVAHRIPESPDASVAVQRRKRRSA